MLAKLLIGICFSAALAAGVRVEFGENLTYEERIFTIAEKLYWPVLWAEELGIELLIEPHGIVTDDVEATEELLERIENPDTIGLNLDTGNLWLGGGDNLEYIEHVHWKGLGAEREPKCGEQFGCGMGLILFLRAGGELKNTSLNYEVSCLALKIIHST